MRPLKPLAAARRSAGYSQEKVGKMLCVDRSTVSSWERGLTHPTAGQVLAMARLYNVSPERVRCGVAGIEAGSEDQGLSALVADGKPSHSKSCAIAGRSASPESGGEESRRGDLAEEVDWATQVYLFQKYSSIHHLPLVARLLWNELSFWRMELGFKPEFELRTDVLTGSLGTTKRTLMKNLEVLDRAGLVKYSNGGAPGFITFRLSLLDQDGSRVFVLTEDR